MPAKITQEDPHSQSPVAGIRPARTVVNSIANTAAYIWPVLLYVLVTPTVISRIGTDAYGVLSLVLTLVSFLGFLDLGLSSAALKYVAEYRVQGKHHEINRVIGSLLTLYLVAGGVGCLVITCATPWLVTRLLKIPLNLHSAASFCFYAASVGFILTMLVALFSSIPKAVQRYDVTARITISASTLSSVLMVVLVLKGYGVRALVIGSLMVNAFALFGFMKQSTRLLPGLSLRPKFDRTLVHKLFSFSLFLLSTQITGAILFQFDRIAIGTFIGASALTFYVVPAALGSKVHGVVNSITNVLFPLSSELSASQTPHRLRELYVRATKYVTALSLSAAVPLAVFSRPLLTVWLGASFADHSTRVMQVLLFSYLLISLSAVPFYLFSGLGRPHIVAIYSFISAVFNVAGCFILIPRWGLLGAAWASFAGSCQVPFFMHHLERILGIGYGEMTRVVYWRPIVAATVMLAASLFLLPMATSAARTIAMIALSEVIFGITLFLVGFLDTWDRNLLRQLVESSFGAR